MTNQIGNILDNRIMFSWWYYAKANIKSLLSFSNDELLIGKYNLNKVRYYEQIIFDKINIICDENYLFNCISLSIWNQNIMKKLDYFYIIIKKNNPIFEWILLWGNNSLYKYEKNFEKKQNKFNILLKIILNVLRKLDFLADISNYLIIYTYKII